MNALKIYENAEFGQIRTVEINGEPWFAGKDVAEALGYVKPLNAIAAHVDEDDSLKQGLIDSMGRTQETIIINESGLYSLILGSSLDSAKKFKRWITSEVIPSIRKTGSYNLPQTYACSQRACKQGRRG
jgi:prophage antirepressor-like protein